MRITQSSRCGLVACAMSLFTLSADVIWAQPPAQEPADAQSDMAAPAGLGALQIRGFNDLNFRAFQDGERPNRFTIGQLDLFLSSRLSPEINVIGELVVEAGDDNAVGVDLERMLLQYSPN